MTDKAFQARTYKPGRQIEYTAVSDIAAGDVIVVGTIVAFAPEAIAAGDTGFLETEGAVWGVAANEAWSQGDAIYWKTTGDPYLGTAGSGAFTTTATGATLAGFARQAKDSTDQTGCVQLTSASRTATIGGSITANDITGGDSSLGVSGISAAQGGAVALLGGTSSTAGNAGGAVTATGGTPGVSGAGGAVTLVGAAGGSTSGTGGAVTATGGAGTAGNSAGGPVTLTGGAGQGSAAGGAASLVGGAGGATGTGGAIAVTGGAGGATSGTGGAIVVAGGAGSGGNANGGALTLRGGAKNGSGTDGAIAIGDSNTASIKLGPGGSEAAAIKGIYTPSANISVAVPSITDPDIAKVDVDVSSMTFQPAVGDVVIAIPQEALPSNCRLQGAWVSATDTVQVVFGSEGGNVTGASKNFKFLFIDLT